jgi:hypothetical protein
MECHSGSLLLTVPLRGLECPLAWNAQYRCSPNTDSGHLAVMPLRFNTGPLRVAADPAALLGILLLDPTKIK